MPTEATTDEQIAGCFDVMVQLRPHLQRDEFVALVRHMQGEGYRLVYIAEQQKVVAAAGFAVYTNLHLGKNLYVEDLVTAEEVRSQGYGEQLIEWLRQTARQAQCQYFHLDSGTQRARAHKFYFAHGFTIASYHFSEQL